MVSAQGVGILEISDINQGGRHRFFGSDLLFIRGVNQLFFNFLLSIMRGESTFFSIFYFFDGVFTLPKPTFSVEFFVIDRLYVYLVTNLMIIQLQILLISKLI
jgi:hypothetical protein